MNNKYELWTRWPREEWKFFKSDNDLSSLRITGKRLSKSLGVDYKIFAVERFEQPI